MGRLQTNKTSGRLTSGWPLGVTAPYPNFFVPDRWHPTPYERHSSKAARKKTPKIA